MIDSDIDRELEVLSAQQAELEKKKAELLSKRRNYDEQVKVIADLQAQMNAAFDAQKAAIAQSLGIELGHGLGSDEEIPITVEEAEPVNGIRRPAIS